MVGKSQYDHIKRGVATWNSWRAQEVDIDIDLSRANLREAHLHKANLLCANLAGADLRGADLSYADLRGAELRDTDFSGADLRDARLDNASFYYTNFTKALLCRTSFVSYTADQYLPIVFSAPIFRDADLRDADLRRAQFLEAEVRGADFTGADLRGADLTNTDFGYSNLTEANLTGANLSGMDLTQVQLGKADLSRANLAKANLRGVMLTGAILNRTQLREAILVNTSLAKTDLYKADLSGANLSGANLTNSRLVETNLNAALLKSCLVYGISAWNLELQEATQLNLNINPIDQPTISVDSLELAQFIYLLLNNEKIRQVIDTLTGTAVLILGRFTKKRMDVLSAIADKLRYDFGDLPIIFNFDKPVDRSISETVHILASLCKFVIVDLTDPKSTPYESRLIVPNLAVPFLPIIQAGQEAFSMVEDLYDYSDRLLEGFKYRNKDHLLDNLGKLREEALIKRNTIREKRTNRQEVFREELP